MAIVVPSNNVSAFRRPVEPPSDTFTLMAAAQMHMEGRLIEAEQKFEEKPSEDKS